MKHVFAVGNGCLVIVHLQKSASIEPRTSPPKFGKFWHSIISIAIIKLRVFKIKNENGTNVDNFANQGRAARVAYLWVPG